MAYKPGSNIIVAVDVNWMKYSGASIMLGFPREFIDSYERLGLTAVLMAAECVSTDTGSGLVIKRDATYSPGSADEQTVKGLEMMIPWHYIQGVVAIPAGENAERQIGFILQTKEK